MYLVQQKRRGLFKPRLPQNVVISAFFNALAVVIWNDYRFPVLSLELHVATLLALQNKTVFLQHHYYIFY